MDPKRYSRKPLGCGILGSHNIDIERNAFKKMLETISHRGPDGTGVWESYDGRTVFGHNRLSIIGIDERGSQPFIDKKNNLVITFNGEIYNYIELRQDLEDIGHIFYSTTDTEVILYSYKQWGFDCLNKFNGIFAFAIYDGNNDILFLARDHIGVKPLLYAEINGGIIFSSESKAILKYPGFTVKPNYDSIRSTWIHHLWQDNRETWFYGIRSLQPGHYMIIDRKDEKKTVGCYWDITVPGCYHDGNIDGVYGQFRHLILDSLKLQTRSDVGFSTTTSGGLDSSVITSIIAQTQNQKVDTFTVKYQKDHILPPLDLASLDFTEGLSRSIVDLWNAKKLASYYDNINLIEVDVDENYFNISTIDRIIYSLEQMSFDTRIMALYKLYEKIRSRGHKVTLIGQGPDEVWIGYYYDDDFWRYPPEKTSVSYLSNVHFPNEVPFGYSSWNPDFMTKRLAQESSRNNLEYRLSHFKSGDSLNDICYIGQKTILESILLIEDRMSMCHSIEARVPWVDYRLMELAFKIPSYLKIDPDSDNKAKYFNRKALEGMIPDFILKRRKSPLPHPPSQYIDNILNNLIMKNHEKMISSQLLRSIFTKAFLENLLNDKNINMGNLFKIFTLWRFEKIFFE